jgi:hypothetical protein
MVEYIGTNMKGFAKTLGATNRHQREHTTGLLLRTSMVMTALPEATLEIFYVSGRASNVVKIDFINERTITKNPYLLILREILSVFIGCAGIEGHDRTEGLSVLIDLSY